MIDSSWLSSIIHEFNRVNNDLKDHGIAEATNLLMLLAKLESKCEKAGEPTTAFKYSFYIESLKEIDGVVFRFTGFPELKGEHLSISDESFSGNTYLDLDESVVPLVTGVDLLDSKLEEGLVFLVKGEEYETLPDRPELWLPESLIIRGRRFQKDYSLTRNGSTYRSMEKDAEDFREFLLDSC